MSLENYFPNLKPTGYSVTSPATRVYNCIAWAAGVTDDWWWPDPLGVSSWPPAARREEPVAAFIEAFASLGYFPTVDESLEPGFEKVALYASAARPTPGGSLSRPAAASASLKGKENGRKMGW